MIMRNGKEVNRKIRKKMNKFLQNFWRCLWKTISYVENGNFPRKWRIFSVAYLHAA